MPMVIGRVVICHGCCCGDVDRGKSEVPVGWLKQARRKRSLLKNIRLSICGCLGPCDLANVVKVSSSDDVVWLGNIAHFEIATLWTGPRKAR